jgi:diguanylate cyclase (GGDEF)-like protein/PAS domain S-box-containing protein
MSPPQPAQPIARAEPALGQGPETLVALCPGPALFADSRGELAAWNEPALPLAEALAQVDDAPLSAALARVAQTGRPAVERVRLPGPPGAPERTYDLTLLPHSGGALAVGRDTTVETHLASALVASRKLFKDLVACSTDFAWETDAQGRFCFVSPAGALGFSAAALNGRRADALLLAAPGRAGPPPFSARVAVKDAELMLRQADGSAACMLTSSVPAFDAGGRWTGSRGVCRDVTELRAAQAKLAELARTDELTGLLNRRAFEDEVDRRIGHSRRTGRWSALLYFDLDNFKPINDARGHAAGDAALREFARLVSTANRAGDVAARLGGDEFALWLEETGMRGALAKAEILLDSFEALRPLSAAEWQPLTVSIGVAAARPGYAGGVADLLAEADAAMYRAKRDGKGRISLAFDDDPEPDADGEPQC